MAKSILHKGSIVFYAAWWIVWMLLHVTVLHQYGVDKTASIVDSWLSMFLMAAACLLILNNMRYYLPKKEKYWYVFAISFVLTVLWIILLKLILSILFKDNVAYLALLNKSVTLRFGFAFIMISCVSAISLVWYTQQGHLQSEEQKKEVEKLAKEAELFKLRQQLQPHFLFNSLNSISALTGSQPEKARHMIQQLSDFLRGTLKKEDHHWNLISEELKYLELYLDIEKVRFGHRLQTDIQIDESVMAIKIPALLLQPVVENAIKFGLYDTIGDVTIRILAKKSNHNVLIEVTNSYDPETAQPLHGTGFGLPSVKRRLFLLFGRNDLFQTKQADNQFTTLITIPETI